MSFGRMDRRITIEQNTPTADGRGGQTDSWTPLAVVWAQKMDQAGGEPYREGGDLPEQITDWKIWWRSDVRAKMRIDYNGQKYNILNVQELGRKEKLKLSTRAIIEQTV